MIPVTTKTEAIPANVAGVPFHNPNSEGAFVVDRKSMIKTSPAVYAILKK